MIQRCLEGRWRRTFWPAQQVFPKIRLVRDLENMRSNIQSNHRKSKHFGRSAQTETPTEARSCRGARGTTTPSESAYLACVSRGQSKNFRWTGCALGLSWRKFAGVPEAQYDSNFGLAPDTRLFHLACSPLAATSSGRVARESVGAVLYAGVSPNRGDAQWRAPLSGNDDFRWPCQAFRGRPPTQQCAEGANAKLKRDVKGAAANLGTRAAVV